MKGRLQAVLRKIIPSSIWKPLSVLKKFIANRDAKGLRSINFLKDKSDVIVLGNGPSLKNDLEKIAAMTDHHDFVCVNNFCSSPYYETFKPNKYVFLDSYFFKEDVHFDWIKQREATFKNINEKTQWPMQIFLPASADDRIVRSSLTNKNIEVIKVNVTPVFFEKYNFLTKKLLSSGFIGPANNNVLIYAIFYCLFSGYDSICIYGADMTIYSNIEVDQKDNNLNVVFKHFNKNTKSEKFKTGPLKKHTPNYAEMMYSAYRVFKQHEIIQKFSCDAGIRIYNNSSYSLIDAYKRNR